MVYNFQLVKKYQDYWEAIEAITYDFALNGEEVVKELRREEILLSKSYIATHSTLGSKNTFQPWLNFLSRIFLSAVYVFSPWNTLLKIIFCCCCSLLHMEIEQQ